MCCVLWNHIGVLFSVYIRYYQRLYTIQVKKCSQKVEDTHMELFSLGVIFYKFFFGDTLYSFSYSKDTNIHVFNHSTS